MDIKTIRNTIYMSLIMLTVNSCSYFTSANRMLPWTPKKDRFGNYLVHDEKGLEKLLRWSFNSRKTDKENGRITDESAYRIRLQVPYDLNKEAAFYVDGRIEKNFRCDPDTVIFKSYSDGSEIVIREEIFRLNRKKAIEYRDEYDISVDPVK